MEMRSDKTGELKKRERWGREKKARLQPPEWLDSKGCEFNSSGSQLSSRPYALRKMIKDAMRSVFKDESEDLLWLPLPPIFLFFSHPALNIFDLLLQMMVGQADRGQSLVTCGKCPSFPCGHSTAVTNVALCAHMATRHAVGRAKRCVKFG